MDITGQPHWDWMKTGLSDAMEDPHAVAGLPEHFHTPHEFLAPPVLEVEPHHHVEVPVPDLLPELEDCSNSADNLGWAPSAAVDVWPNFDPQTMDPVFGNPGQDMQYWHLQETPMSCAVAVQEFGLESLTGQPFTEAMLRQEASTHGWYTPGGGTPAYAMGNLMAAHGIPVVHEYGVNLEHLSAKLAAGEKVFVGVDPDEIWRPDQPDYDDTLAHAWGMPERGATHAVQLLDVIPDPSHPQVVLNDPGHPDGRGAMVPLERFLDGWEDSGYMAVSTTVGSAGAVANVTSVPPAAHPPEPALAGADSMTSAYHMEGPGPYRPGVFYEHEPRFAGYYNGDGTYHYTSDNTDRDPQTGAIVRRY